MIQLFLFFFVKSSDETWPFSSERGEKQYKKSRRVSFGFSCDETLRPFEQV